MKMCDNASRDKKSVRFTKMTSITEISAGHDPSSSLTSATCAVTMTKSTNADETSVNVAPTSVAATGSSGGGLPAVCYSGRACRTKTLSMSSTGTGMDGNIHARCVYKVVLTGGPCGGKTTGQDRLGSFFEQLGWKVYRVPETATVLLNSGVKFAELNSEEATRFQENLLLTMMHIEKVFDDLASTCPNDCLIICDRGSMDPSAYIENSLWRSILHRNDLNEIDLRDNRYNQVVHMVTAADGAADFYTLSTNSARSEDVKEAINRDAITRSAWLGFPYFDVVDNQFESGGQCSFEDKILKLIQVVCDRAGVKYGDRLAPNSRKRKWLVTAIDMNNFPQHQTFDVVHDFLLSENSETQRRIRRRGQNGRYSYTATVRRVVNGVPIETKMTISKREYDTYLQHHDSCRVQIPKIRRCFNYGQQYYQLDEYVPPLPPHTPEGTLALIILETYTTRDDLHPPHEFLTIDKEITGNPAYSMYNMALK